MGKNRRGKRSGHRNRGKGLSRLQGSGGPNSPPPDRASILAGVCMHIPQQASGSAPGAGEGQKPAAPQPDRWWVVRQVLGFDAEVVFGTEDRRSALKSYGQRKSAEKANVVRFGVIQAPNREVAIDLWNAQLERDLEEKTRPAPTAPTPGTEAARTFNEESSYTRIGDQGGDDDQEDDHAEEMRGDRGDRYQEDDDETTT